MGAPAPQAPRTVSSARRLALVAAAVAVAVTVALAFLAAFPAARPVHIVVSNQSLDHPFANITVTVDGAVVVDQSFFVADSHNFTQFDTVATRGVVLFGERDTGAAGQVTLSPFGERWVTILFRAGGAETPHLTISDSSVAPAFA